MLEAWLMTNAKAATTNRFTVQRMTTIHPSHQVMVRKLKGEAKLQYRIPRSRWILCSTENTAIFAN